jgi:hypothetical protein
MTSVMPKGVEHCISPIPMPRTIPVMTSVMPKGVEHNGLGEQRDPQVHA